MSSKQKKLDFLKAQMEKDTSLPLRKGAKELVFGVGNPDADMLFMGEGPGYWEDQKGEPFVGNAGKFLDQLLHLIKVDRSDVYITNVVHHRPPNNRDPEPNEIEAYGKYLDKMIDIINPKVIITLGRFSMAKFLPGVYISSVHGKPHKVSWKEKSFLVVPMYHPAAGLRNGGIKAQTVRDFVMLSKRVEENPVGKNGKKEEFLQMKLV